MSDTYLTSTEVAKLLGVGATSVKRWADTGVLECERTPGRHRRFTRSSVEALLRERQAARTGGVSFDRWVEEWVELLLSDGDPHWILSRLYAERAKLGSWAEVAQRLGSVATEIGERWSCGRLPVSDEQRATERLARALGRVAESLPSRPDAERCLLAVAEGEEHTLGLTLVELCVREAGWDVERVDGRGPEDALVRQVGRGDARALLVSASSASSDRAELTRQAERLGSVCAERGVRLVLGGAGAWPEDREDAVRLHDLRAIGSFLGDDGSGNGHDGVG